ncbi:GAF domain-containing protein [Nocardia sp. NPDC058518]|uniref:GAF domain-containing protein n=1 Tax=Nocardia sp. NPDC058518 TaxID=3346534 RepID=UPI003650A977
MIIGRWQLVETLGTPQTWSMLTAGTTPREWASYQRAIPARLQPLIAAAHDTGAPVEEVLPKSRNPWSELRFRAVPVLWPGSTAHAVKVWVGPEVPRDELRVAPFQVDARARVMRTHPAGLGPHFGSAPVEYSGAEPFQRIERFDQALEFVATMYRSDPRSRWSGVATVHSRIGPRSLLVAARNGSGDQQRFAWRGVAVDVTDSIAPQHKSFEAATLELLRESRPGLYLVILDTAQVRAVRWVTEPMPGLTWRGVDERTVPHPDDRPRIAALRAEVLAGATHAGLSGLRLAAESGGWLTVDVEVSPLPSGGTAPAFMLAQLQVTAPPG